MYLTTKQQGEHVWLFAFVQNSEGAQALPVRVPYARIYRAGTFVAAVPLSCVDRYNSPGLFGRWLLLDSTYTAGIYQVQTPIAVGGSDYMDGLTFEVMSGGNADGAVVALAGFPRPEADYLVMQLDGGKLVQGRNPRLSRAEGTF